MQNETRLPNKLVSGFVTLNIYCRFGDHLHTGLDGFMILEERMLKDGACARGVCVCVWGGNGQICSHGERVSNNLPDSEYIERFFYHLAIQHLYN